MRIAAGADHAGYDLKEHLVAVLRAEGHEVVDVGTYSAERVDYPAYCAAAARLVARGEADRGLVIGGSGQGEQLAANTVAGVRASLCNDLFTARLARAHNDANVLALGARVVADGLAEEILAVWLATPFDGGRHEARITQLSQLQATSGDVAAQDALLESLVPGITRTRL